MVFWDTNEEEEYLDGAEQLLGTDSLLIYAEDPEFYGCYLTPKTTIYPEGMSCDRVRKHVIGSSNANVAGIVDGDFNDAIEHENLFKINFYSIENIALLHHRTMKSLKQQVLEYLNNNFSSKHRLRISFDGDQTTLCQHTRVPSEFNDYLVRKIRNSENYISFMDLKEVVQIYGRRTNPRYQKTLPHFVKFEKLFSDEECERIIGKLLEYDAIDIPAIPEMKFS